MKEGWLLFYFYVVFLFLLNLLSIFPGQSLPDQLTLKVLDSLDPREVATEHFLVPHGIVRNHFMLAHIVVGGMLTTGRQLGEG